MMTSAPQSQPVKLFFSYSHKDERLRDKLAAHLSIMQRDGLIESWHDRKITGGSEWAGAIDENLNSAKIILLLITADFLASNYCYDIEMKRAMERHQVKEALVIPIILKPVDWSRAPFGKLQAFPTDAKPVTKWSNREDAFLNIAKGIRTAVEELAKNEILPSINTSITLDVPEGQVPINSPFYVERPPIEKDCYEAIIRPGALIRIKAPRQMGKSSLMARILHHGSQQGYQSVSVNFQAADGEFFANLDQFLQWFCASIADELNLRDNLESYWKGILGSKSKCSNYFQRYLLTQIDNPIVLGLDEVDQVFQYTTVAQDFFGLLRAWHEKSKNDPIWQKLRLVIAHSKEVYIPLNINQSPFNVGLPIELPEFLIAQIEDLVKRHGLNFSGEELNQLMGVSGGHSYLVRVALYQIARQNMSLKQLLETAPTEAGIYGDHLRRHLLNLEGDTELLAAFKNVIAANSPIQIGSSEAFRLRSMGLVKLFGNKVTPLCDLYRQYFSERLGVNSSY